MNDLKRATFPDAKLGEVEVLVNYPGAASQKVESSLCYPLERAVEGLIGIDEIQCFAQPNFARLLVKSLEGANFERLLQDVKSEIESLDTLPEESSKPIISHSNRLDPVISLVVSSNMSEQHLFEYAHSLKDRIYQETEIARVSILGFSQSQIQIRLEESVLRHYNLSIPQIAKAIASQNRDIPIGVLHTRGQELRFTIEEEKNTIPSLVNLVILSKPDGFELKLGDFATIENGFEYEEQRIDFEGQRAAILQFQMNPTDDVLDLTKQVKSFINKESQKYGSTIQFHFTRDNAGIVNDRLKMLTNNAIQGLILVFLVLYLFFGLKFSIWVVLGLPVSFAGAFYLMIPLEQSINMMSMVGLLLAIGILMDDAVVISENIAAHYDQGKGAIEAAIDGTQEVFSSVLSSFLTTVAMFSGLIFMSGDIGRILKAIPIVLILVLGISLLEAFLILPHHVKESLKRIDQPSRIRAMFMRQFIAFQQGHFQRVLRFCLKNRYSFVGITIITLSISLSVIASGRLKFSAIPDLEGNTIVARIAMPPGTPLKTTEHVAQLIKSKMQVVANEYKSQYSQNLVRGIYTRYSHNLDTQESGPHVATVTVDLISPEERKISLAQILSNWEELVGKVPGSSYISYQEPVLGPSGRPLHLRLFHSDMEILMLSSSELLNELSKFSGVNNLMRDLRIGQPQLNISLQEGITGTGLNVESLGQQLYSAIRGHKIQDLNVGEEISELVISASKENQSRIDFVDHFHFKLNDEKTIPMEQAGIFTYKRDWARISRSQGKRMVNVTAEIDSKVANAAEIINHLSADFLKLIKQKYPGLEIKLEGEVKNASQTGSSIQSAFLSGLVGLFLILSYQFGCYLQPIFILLTIPLSLIGVIWGHLLLGFNLSLPSMMGFVALTGVMVNNSIMLVHFVEVHLNDGLSQSEAAIQASMARFRPIFITTATTLVGMLPLLFEKSLQAQILQPLVISLCFGLASSTILVLVYLPCLYGILDDLRYRVKLASADNP